MLLYGFFYAIIGIMLNSGAPYTINPSRALDLITLEISKENTRFVFPSETAAGLWARKACAAEGVRSLARNRFIAWDRFKEEAVQTEDKNRMPVTAVLRKLFAEKIIKKNSIGPEPLFHSLIPPQYAGEGRIFVSSIAALLSPLGLWETLRGNPSYKPSAEDAREDDDFEILKKEYTAFLDGHKLFEPSWEKPPLKDKKHRYYIFFPEAMEDFSEFKNLLENEQTITIVHLEKSGPSVLFRFDSLRAEIRALVLEIRRMYEEQNIPYEDMALSSPDLETLAPYLQRELELYAIPYRRSSGRPLASYGAGRLFSHINNCVSNNFSFSFLKSMLLDGELPWKAPERNKELILFGIKNNCVSSYRENGRIKDIWEDAFKADRREEQLRAYYSELKKKLKALAEADTFSRLRKAYFAFRRDFLDMEKIKGQEGDAVLARCIEELTSLIHLEDDYTDIIPDAPFSFYLGLLAEKQYVRAREGGGIQIFPYRVAAGAPFACHFVINASQDAATVLYRPLRFLRQDKRQRLALTDVDASPDFFRLYNFGGTNRLWVSCSDQGLSRWAIPCSFFVSSTVSKTAGDKDPFLEEKAWWAAGASAGNQAAFPLRLFPVQKQGFKKWRTLSALKEKGGFNILQDPFPAEYGIAETAARRIREVQWGVSDKSDDARLRASATDLNTFFFCPLKWFYLKILGLEVFSLEARMLDDRSLGNLYHEILRNVFNAIREKDRCFIPGHLEQYLEFIRFYTEEAAVKFPAFKGPLASPLITAQAQAISKILGRLLKTEIKYFPGCAVRGTELKLWSSIELSSGPVWLMGIIDRVSAAGADEVIIVDYKTGKTPAAAESSLKKDGTLEDFQLPVYVKLYEDNFEKAKAGSAVFMSVKNNKVNTVIGKMGGARGHTREEYEQTIASLNGFIEKYALSLDKLMFHGEIQQKKCRSCEYNGLCRSAYMLNPEDEDEQ
jgi:RecB family exonuclease